MKNICRFAQVCSQHICTVVCSLTHKLGGTHTLQHTHMNIHTGAYVISSMHSIPHMHTHLPNQTVTLGWQSPGAAAEDHDTQRHFVTYRADAVCCCQPASQPSDAIDLTSFLPFHSSAQWSGHKHNPNDLHLYSTAPRCCKTDSTHSHTYTHSHTHIYKYIYEYIYCTLQADTQTWTHTCSVSTQT